MATCGLCAEQVDDETLQPGDFTATGEGQTPDKLGKHQQEERQ